MVYGDLAYLDIFIFAGVAVFLIVRLRGVLGKRQGFNQKKSKTNPPKEIQEDKEIKIPQLNDNEKKLSIAYTSINNFDHKNFLEGVKFAFETIINAFNNGDKKTLKNMLTGEVYNSFVSAIDEGDNSPNFQFYSLVINSVESVVVESDIIKITLKITSEQFKDNDESTISKKQDIWTFQKHINSKSLMWLLSAT